MTERIRDRVVRYEEYTDRDGYPCERSVVEQYAAIRCRCGAEVELFSSWLNSCDACGRDYNMSGQLLAPREQWGNDTNETLSQLLNYSQDEYGNVTFQGMEE